MAEPSPAALAWAAETVGPVSAVHPLREGGAPWLLTVAEAGASAVVLRDIVSATVNERRDTLLAQALRSV